MVQQITGTRRSRITIPAGTRIKASKDEYVVQGPHGEDGTGASGTVVVCRGPSGNTCIVKLYFPQELEDDVAAATDETNLFSLEATRSVVQDAAHKTSRHEATVLAQLDHPSIVKLLDSGELVPEDDWMSGASTQRNSVPFNVLEHVDGPRLETWMRENRSWPEVLHLIRSLCDGLEHMHSREILHADIKLDNIRMRLSGEPVILDFGAAISFRGVTADLSDRVFSVPRPRISSASIYYEEMAIARRNPGSPLKHKHQFFPWFDVMCLAVMLRQSEVAQLSALPENVKIHLTNLLDAVETDTRRQAPTAAILRDLVSKTESSEVINYLSNRRVERTVPLANSVVALRGPADKIIDIPEFSRLHEIKQLGLVDQVYRGATHTRFYHSISTYGVMQDLVESLLAARDPYLSRLWSPRLAHLALCTALLHDLGHFHFMHVFEESHLLQQRQEVRDFRRDIFLDLCEGLRGEHSFGGSTIEDLLQSVGLAPGDVLAALRGQYEMNSAGAPDSPPIQENTFSAQELQLIHSLIDSGVDVDKIAYVADDAFFAGTTYGLAVDRGMLLKHARIAEDPSQGLVLTFDDQAVPAVEAVLLARHWAFKTMYWHHTHRAFMAMILRVVDDTFSDLRTMRAFLMQSLYSGQAEFLRLLDAEYRKKHGKPSILCGLPLDRQLVFRRLCSLQPFPENSIEAIVGTRLRSWLSEPEESRVKVAALARALNGVLDQELTVSSGQKVPITFDDLLIDFPGRRVDDPGRTLITSNGNLEPIQSWSACVAGLDTQFERLSKYVRVFVNPMKLPGWSGQKRREYHSKVVACLNQSIPN